MGPREVGNENQTRILITEVPTSEYLSLLREENAKRAERPFRSIRDTAEGERAEHGLCHRTLLPWPEKLTLGLVTILVKYLINL